VKNKVAPPFRTSEFDIMYGEGISKTGEIVDMGVDFGIVQKSGAWYSYDGAKIAQGRDGAKQFFMDNPEVAREIEGKIREKISAGLVRAAAVPASVAASDDGYVYDEE
jgi:recombination protein RecA